MIIIIKDDDNDDDDHAAKDGTRPHVLSPARVILNNLDTNGNENGEDIIHDGGDLQGSAKRVKRARTGKISTSLHPAAVVDDHT